MRVAASWVGDGTVVPAQPLLGAPSFVDDVVAWSTSNLSSRNAAPPGRGWSSRDSRNAALATASASIGSDFPRVTASAPVGRGQLRRPAAAHARRATLARARVLAAGSPRAPTTAQPKPKPPTRQLGTVDRGLTQASQAKRRTRFVRVHQRPIPSVFPAPTRASPIRSSA